MIACLGEILIDRYPSKDGVKDYVGGAPFNVAYAITQMGEEALFLGNVGKDKEGKKIQSFFEEKELDLSGLTIHPSLPTLISQVTLKNGERSFAFPKKETCFDCYTKESLGRLKRAEIAHFGSLLLTSQKGRDTLREALTICKENTVFTSFDVNFREDLFQSKAEAKEIYLSLLPSFDLVKLSEDELFFLTSTHNITDALAALPKGPQVYLVTCGSKGALAYNDGEIVKADPFQVHVVDTTGAGDCFLGAFLSQLSSLGIDTILEIPSLLKSNLLFANAAASLTCTKKGALPGIPTYQETERFLSKKVHR